MELDVLTELNDHSLGREIRRFEVREVNWPMASQVLATVFAKYACRRGLRRNLAARENALLGENGLVEVVV
jgi:hypothetical protein